MRENKSAIYTFGISDPNENLVKRYFQSKTTDLCSISLFQILTRRIRFSSVPELALANSPLSLIKRKLIKLLGLTVDRDISSKCLEEILFLNHGNKVLFCPGKIASEIYSIHCPQIKTIEIYSKYRDTSLENIMRDVSDPINIDRSKGVSVFVNPTSTYLLNLYRKFHPNKKIIVRLHDWIGNERSELYAISSKLTQLRSTGVIDSIESYNKSDSIYLNAIYRPNGANGRCLVSFDSKVRTSLVVFLGTTSRSKGHINRANTLKKIQTELESIYPSQSIWINMRTIKDMKNRISYSCYLEQLTTAEVFLDLIRIDPREGFSFRVPESLFLNRKIITDRVDIMNERFFSSERVYIIGGNNKYDLKTFLENDVQPLSKNTLRYYDSTLWWTKADPYI